MNLPDNDYIPDDPDKMPPARRRRANRLLVPMEADERAEFLDRLALRTTPTFDFFLFSLISGVVIGIGLITDAPALLVLGALLAPLMAPAVGVALGTITGSVKLFSRSLIALLVSAALVFATGALAGLAAQVAQTWLPLEFSQIYLYSQISWPNFVVLAVGAVWAASAMVHSERNPAMPSAALAYVLHIPLVVAGFGLTSGFPHLWPDGLVIYAVYLAWAALLGSVTLAVMGFRPLTLFGYTVGGAVTLLGIILLIGISGAGAIFGAQVAVPTAIPTPTATITPVPPIPPTITLTATPLPPTNTPTRTITSTPTVTSTYTPIPTPTPVYAIIRSTELGACVRDEPDQPPCHSYLNGTLVQVLPDTIEENGAIWAHVIVVQDGREGWILQSLLVAATPEPGW